MDHRMAKLREKLRDLTLFDDELMTLAFHRDCEFYVNGACMDDTLLGRIMHDFQCKSPNEMKCYNIARKLQAIKEIKEEKKMGALYDYIYAEGLDDGLEKGRGEGALNNCAQMICKHIRKSKCTLVEALEWFEVSEEDAPKVCALVYDEFERQKKSELQWRETSVESLKAQALLIVQYMDKIGCSVQEALEFFQIPESDYKWMMDFVNCVLEQRR